MTDQSSGIFVEPIKQKDPSDMGSCGAGGNPTIHVENPPCCHCGREILFFYWSEDEYFGRKKKNEE